MPHKFEELPAVRLQAGLRILIPRSDCIIHTLPLRYPGLGLECLPVPLHVEDQLNGLGWAWSCDAERDGNQLWIFTF